MRIKSNLSMRKIADEYIMIVDNGDSLDYTRAISLNETAVYLIEAVKAGEFTTQQWADLLQARYDVDAETALRDTEVLISKLTEAGVIEP